MIDPIKLTAETENQYIDFTEFEITPFTSVVRPIPVLSIKQDNKLIDVFTEDNISMLKGQAKSRKSTLIKLICQGINCGNQKFVSGSLRRNIAIIDTEQSKWHCYRAAKMIYEISGNRQVKYYTASQLSLSQKKELVEHILESDSDCGLVIIDNIVHFLNNFNDVNESSELTQWLVEIKSKFNTHICCVLHENAGDSGKARGHLGTNLKNLCETEIKIALDYSDKRVSIVSADATRGIPFDDFSITIDEKGYPKIIGDIGFSAGKIEIPNTGLRYEKEDLY